MGLFGCRHEWYVVAKTFMEPDPKGDAEWTDQDACERARAGVTTVLMACDACGSTKTTEMLGREIT